MWLLRIPYSAFAHRGFANAKYYAVDKEIFATPTRNHGPFRSRLPEFLHPEASALVAQAKQKILGGT